MKSNSFKKNLLAALILLSFAACSKDTDSQAEAVVEQKAAPLATGQSISITGNDASKYSITEFEVLPNQEITLEFYYDGSMKMKHNIVILDKGTDSESFSMKSASSIDNDYITTDPQFKIIAKTAMIGPKEKDSITFTTPSEPGVYPYVCTFPGHYFIGMKGKMIVVAP